MRNTTVSVALLGLALSGAACFKSEVSFAYYPDSASGLPLDMLVVRYDDGERSRTLVARDFRTSQDQPVPHTARFETPTSVTLTVDVLLRDAGDTVAAATIEIPTYPDILLLVAFHSAEFDPFTQCKECLGGAVIRMRDPSRGDSLLVVWRGEQISSTPGY